MSKFRIASIAVLMCACSSALSGSAGADEVTKQSMSTNGQADCNFGRKCAEARASEKVSAALSAQCKTAKGERAFLTGSTVAIASCTTSGGGQAGQTGYRCTANASAECVAPVGG